MDQAGIAHCWRHGPDSSLELKAFSEARLEVLRAAQAAHAAAYHYADALAKGFAFLHAARRHTPGNQIETTREG